MGATVDFAFFATDVQMTDSGIASAKNVGMTSARATSFPQQFTIAMVCALRGTADEAGAHWHLTIQMRNLDTDITLNAEDVEVHFGTPTDPFLPPRAVMVHDLPLVADGPCHLEAVLLNAAELDDAEELARIPFSIAAAWEPPQLPEA